MYKYIDTGMASKAAFSTDEVLDMLEMLSDDDEYMNPGSDEEYEGFTSDEEK